MGIKVAFLGITMAKTEAKKPKIQSKIQMPKEIKAAYSEFQENPGFLSGLGLAFSPFEATGNAAGDFVFDNTSALPVPLRAGLSTAGYMLGSGALGTGPFKSGAKLIARGAKNLAPDVANMAEKYMMPMEMYAVPPEKGRNAFLEMKERLNKQQELINAIKERDFNTHVSQGRSPTTYEVPAKQHIEIANTLKAAGFAEGGKVKDPFAELSVLDKAALLAKAAKYRIQYNKQATEHGKYPEELLLTLKAKYRDQVGNSRIDRSPLDAALNYGGGYDFGVRQDIPADVARDMGKAYQYTDYFFSPFTGPKSDAVGDYYENMAGVEAGIKERSHRASDAEIQRRSAEYGQKTSKMLPQHVEEDYAEGGEVHNDFNFAEIEALAQGFKEGGPVLSVGRGEKLPVSQGAGLTAKGRAKYNSATGGNLKAPAPHPKTEKDAARRASFCARMSGMPGPMKDANGNPTRKAASLKRWNCN